MKPFFRVEPLPLVLERMAHIPRLGPETVTLEQAAGRTLTHPLLSPHDLPGFRRSTMDGFAVRAQDTFGASETSPCYLTLAGEVLMGQPPPAPLRPGQCLRIGTGGMLPEGASAVVMVEHTRLVRSGEVEIARPAAPGSNVTDPADDAAAGQQLLPAGHLLRPQDVGLLAALGQLRVEVVQRPRVGILSTGDEVVPVSATPAPGQVRDVNSSTLQCQCRAAGAEPVPLGLVADDADALRQAVQRSLERCQLTLLSGGSSVGVRDLTRQVFLSFPGADLLVHGVSVAPGKPFMWVSCGGHQLLGLPGQTTSCMVAFHLFVEPMLERLLGRPARPWSRFPRLRATLRRPVAAAPGRETYVRVALSREGERWMADPVLGRSGLLRTLVQSDGLARIPLGAEGLDAGAEITVLCFP